MPPFIVRPKEKSEDPNAYSKRNSTPRCPKLTILNIVVNSLKTETISIKEHENHSAQNSHHSHDLTYQSFCKTHVSHGNVALSSIAETHSRGLDAFSEYTCMLWASALYNLQKKIIKFNLIINIHKLTVVANIFRPYNLL
jgi:hypothetical protein